MKKTLRRVLERLRTATNGKFRNADLGARRPAGAAAHAPVPVPARTGSRR